jgi:YggT family protein
VAILHFALNAYTLVVLVSVVCSWLRLAEDHPVVRISAALTEPALTPIRRLLPSTGGLDISPMVLLMALGLVRRLLAV